jgi:L-serine dehydratase
MKVVSILNHVLGPVMRGPSSSHTAGAFHIARMALSLLGERPVRAVFSFDNDGSYAATYAQQGADRAFAMGLLDVPLTDERFFDGLGLASGQGLQVEFNTTKLDAPDHPNTVDIELYGAYGTSLMLRARSVGGGAVEIIGVDGWPVCITGSAYDVLVEVDAGREAALAMALDDDLLGELEVISQEERMMLWAQRRSQLSGEECNRLTAIAGVRGVRQVRPVYFVQTGQPLFASAAEAIVLGEETGKSLGQLGLEYEAGLLGMSTGDVLGEMVKRYEIMTRSAVEGLGSSPAPMQLLTPSAGAIFAAEAAGRLPGGGIHLRAAARAMAVMHVNGAMGVVCAAPTGGAAGVLPGVIVTCAEEKGLDTEAAAMALLAAGAIGVIVATRATFAAEIAGCQVEIGAAGAMAAAAVVDLAGGTVEQAMHAAAISFQNSMGSVCDLVQGTVEIPCHTRNAAAAAGAFVCADLILGGYANPINLDETIDAVYASGKMLPPELRCTSLGGLAITPSALAMKRLGEGDAN